jgi:hypothetical protein
MASEVQELEAGANELLSNLDETTARTLSGIQIPIGNGGTGKPEGAGSAEEEVAGEVEEEAGKVARSMRPWMVTGISVALAVFLAFQAHSFWYAFMVLGIVSLVLMMVVSFMGKRK